MAALTLGAFLLTLPGNAAPVKASDGHAIAVVTHWVRHAAHVAYIDLVHESDHGAALVRHRAGLTQSDFVAERDDVRRRIAQDVDVLSRAHTILTTLGEMTDEWFHLYGANGASPILGPSRLSAEEMVAYVRSTRVRVRTTVPLIDVARMYLEEGEIEGVRGDVAFAQAIKETGDFSSHDVTLNNFAGLGHCSACGHGDGFATARAGVRAQIQLLRWLADPTLRSMADFSAQPATLPVHFLHLGHSRATWTGLGALWAPNPQYGDSVYGTYLRMVSYANRWDGLRG